MITPVITENIPVDPSETLRNQIAFILKAELDNQVSLKGLDDEINVFTGRTTAFQSSEKMIFNVLLDSGNSTSENQVSSFYRYVYYVDLYVSLKEKNDEDADEETSVKRDFYSGMVRYILSDHRNRTLSLPLGVIQNVTVESFDNFEAMETQSSVPSKISRITFAVRSSTNHQLWSGLEFSGSETGMKLEQTQLGYQIVKTS